MLCKCWDSLWLLLLSYLGEHASGYPESFYGAEYALTAQALYALVELQAITSAIYQHIADRSTFRIGFLLVVTFQNRNRDGNT